MFWGRPTTTFDVVGGRTGDALVIWTEAENVKTTPQRERAIVTRTFDPMQATFGPMTRQAVKGAEPIVTVSRSEGAYLAAWATGPESIDRSIFDARLGRRLTVPMFERDHLVPGTSLAGPALVVEAGTSTYVSPSFDLGIDAGGALVLTLRPDAS